MTIPYASCNSRQVTGQKNKILPTTQLFCGPLEENLAIKFSWPKSEFILTQLFPIKRRHVEPIIQSFTHPVCYIFDKETAKKS